MNVVGDYFYFIATVAAGPWLGPLKSLTRGALRCCGPARL